MGGRTGRRSAALAALALAAAGCLDSPPSGISSDAEAGSWHRKARLTFKNAMRRPLAEFPVLVHLDDTLRSALRLSDDLRDLRFLDGDGETHLPFEVTPNLNQDGTTAIWVKVPRVDQTDEDFIWILGDNPDAAAPGASVATTVWTGYGGVWHLEEDDTVFADATGRGNAGQATDATGRVSGIVGMGQRLSGQRIDISPSFVAALENFSVEIWVRLEAIDTVDQFAMSGDLVELLADRLDGVGCAVQVHGSDNTWSDSNAGPTLIADQWSPLAATFRRMGTVGSTTIHFGGQIEGTVETGFTSLWPPAEAIHVGDGVTGIVDELRITTTPHDEFWLWAETENAFGDEASNPFIEYGDAVDI